MIIDTNALFAIVDGDPGIKPFVQSAASVEISAVTLGEYTFGVMQSSRRAHAERWLKDYLRFYIVLAVTEQTAAYYARIRVALKRAVNTSCLCYRVIDILMQWKGSND